MAELRLTKIQVNIKAEPLMFTWIFVRFVAKEKKGSPADKEIPQSENLFIRYYLYGLM